MPHSCNNRSVRHCVFAVFVHLFVYPFMRENCSGANHYDMLDVLALSFIHTPGTPPVLTQPTDYAPHLGDPRAL